MSTPTPTPATIKPPLPLWARVANFPFIVIIKIYQFTLSPLIGRQCRHTPTCSWYGLEAYRTHGPLKGTWLTASRIVRCNPFNKGGYDPVPPRDAGPTRANPR